MAIIASASSNRVPAPSGSHMARCYGVIDLGTHDNPQFGTTARKVLLMFELPTELHTWKEEVGPEPFAVSREFTLSLGKKSNLKPFLEAWRGKSFSEEELAKFDISTLAGAPGLLTIIHETKNGKTYANISQMARLPKAMGECPAPHNKIVVLSLDADFDQRVFDALPEWIRIKVGESPEYKSIANDTPQGGPASGQPADGLTDEDLDVPF